MSKKDILERLDLDDEMKLSILIIAVGCLFLINTVMFIQILGNFETLQTQHEDIYKKCGSESIIQPSIPESRPQNEFLDLEGEAKELIDKYGIPQGTPTFIIDGKRYVGFDVNNQKIPGFQGVLGNSEIIMFSSPTCGFCEKAETFLNQENIDYKKVCSPIHQGDYDRCDETYLK